MLCNLWLSEEEVNTVLAALRYIQDVNEDAARLIDKIVEGEHQCP